MATAAEHQTRAEAAARRAEAIAAATPRDRGSRTGEAADEAAEAAEDAAEAAQDGDTEAAAEAADRAEAAADRTAAAASQELPAGTVVESQDGRRLRGRVVGDGHPLSGWVWVAWQEYGTYDELIEDLTITVDTETETTTERTAEWYRSLAAHCDCEASEATWNEQYETAETWRCAEHVWLLAARATEDGQTQAAEWLASVASQDQAAAEQAASDEDES